MKYESGYRQDIIKLACYYAIQFESSFIEAMTPKFDKPDKETKNVIKISEKHIRDFKKLGKLD